MRTAVHTLAFLLLAAAILAAVWLTRAGGAAGEAGPRPDLVAPAVPDAPPAGLTGIAALSWRQGVASWRAGDYRGAAAMFGRAAAGRPHDPALRFQLGASYLMDGLAEPARQQLRRAVQAAPADARYRYYLGEAEAMAGDATAARTAFAAAEALGGPWGEAARRAKKRR